MKIKMKFYMILIFFSIIFTNKTYANPAHINDSSDFNVLILNSYHLSHKWETNVLEGVTNKLEANRSYAMNIKIEYLDHRNKNDETFNDTFREFLQKKYINSGIDAIYAIDDEAFHFIRKDILDKNSIFYKTPLFFSGVNSLINLSKEEEEYVLGIYESDETLRLLKLINQLHKNVNSINIICEDSGYATDLESQINELKQWYFPNNFSINYIKGNYIEDIDNQLDTLDYSSNSVNIVAGEFQYKKNNSFVNPNDTIDLIKLHTNTPIYSNDQTYLNAGIVGGCVDIGQEHGSIIGGMIMDMKNGKDLKNIGSRNEPKPKYYIDYHSIYDYEINLIDLPEDATIINKKFYEPLLPAYTRKYIIMGLLIIGFLFILALIMLVKLIKNKKQSKIDYIRRKEREKVNSDFIVNLSHELRTPINMIISTAGLIELKALNNKLDSNYILDKVSNINQNSYRLLRLANNIIDITKAESGLFNLNLHNYNIVTVIEDIFLSTLDYANSKNIELIFDTCEEEIITAIDKDQIQRVILNLISNAIKFTTNNGTISCHISENKDFVTVSISDSGIGISKEKLDTIFDRFYQVDNSLSRNNEGSGIGLCIVRDIIFLHGGHIEVDSSIGVGTTFNILLPIFIVENEKINNSTDTNLHNSVNLELSDVY